MKLLIMQFSPAYYYLISLGSNYSPQHPILKGFLFTSHHTVLSRYLNSILQKFAGLFLFSQMVAFLLIMNHKPEKGEMQVSIIQGERASTDLGDVFYNSYVKPEIHPHNILYII
jgi:hypothetical protein